jgi:hypothetical protein
LKILIATIWLCTLDAAFFAGYFWQQPSLQSENGEQPTLMTQGKPENTQHQRVNVYSKSSAQDHIQNPAFASRSKEQDTNQKTLNQIMDMFKGEYDQDLGLSAAAYNMLTTMDEEDLLSDLTYLSAYADDPEYAITLSLYLERYASIAPQKALNFVLNSITSPKSRLSSINIALSKWAQKEPSRALDWYSANSKEFSSRFNPILIDIFASLAKQDQDLAIQALQNHADDDTRLPLAISGIASNLKDSADFINLLEKTAYLDSSTAQRSIVSKWVETDVDGTLDWFSNMRESPDKDRIEGLIFGYYMIDNASNAADWYMSRARPNEMERRASAIIDTWSFSNPEKTLAWVDRQNGIDIQYATRRLLLSAAYNDAPFAIDHLHLLTSNRDKANASARIFGTLQRVNAQNAKMFFEASPYQEEILKRQRGMGRLPDQQ